MPEAWEFTESERGIFDAIDATRTVHELRTLMQPRWDNPNLEIDTLWHLHCERQMKMKEEERLNREHEEHNEACQQCKILLLREYMRRGFLGKAWLKAAKRTVGGFKRKSSLWKH